MKRNPAIAIIMCLLVSFTFSACAPAAPSGQTPEFFHDIGKTLSELKKEHPEGELIVRLDGSPDSAAICFGDPEAEYLYYFFGTLRTPLCKISSTGEIEQRFRLN